MTNARGFLSQLVEPVDIVHWADAIASQSELPILIRKLITATNDQVTPIQMRAHEGIGSPGFDGIVESTSKTRFVPLGKSVWEMGTSGNPNRKANQDYANRASLGGEIDPLEVTFVFVTPRRWTGKNAWVAGKKKNPIWKDVIVFDVDDIMQALEEAPGVHYWFSGHLNKPVGSIQSLQDWWERFSRLPSPALTPSILVQGREDAAATFIEMLQQGRRLITIRTVSADDFLAFVAASICSLDPSLGDGWLDKCLLVKDAFALRELEGIHNSLILFLDGDMMEREALLVKSHFVVLNTTHEGPVDLQIPSIDLNIMRENLEALGVPHEEALTLSRAASQSIPSFLRAAGVSVLPPTGWPEFFGEKKFRRCWLAGGWDATRSGDIAALEVMTELAWSDLESDLRNSLFAAEAVFYRMGAVWSVRNLETTWDYVKNRFVQNDLDSFEHLVQITLGSIDPSLSLPLDQRWASSLYGKSRIHSATLRNSVAATLAFVGTHGSDIELSSGNDLRNWVEGVTWRLLDRANNDSSGDTWASLADILPLLAESAPEIFMAAVDEGLQGNQPVLRHLFTDSIATFTFFSTSPHTNLLNALESLAWNASYLGRVANLLIRLGKLDPGGRFSNRPSSTLTSIFRPLLPQTSADAQSRLEVLDGIIGRDSDSAWNLMKSILPQRRGTLMNSHRPRFRNWGPVSVETTQTGIRDETSDEVILRLLRLAGDDVDRLITLVEHLEELNPIQRKIVSGTLQVFMDENSSDDCRFRLYEPMMTLLRKHKKYSGTSWALPLGEVNELLDIAGAALPTSALLRNRWIFARQVPDIGFRDPEDFDGYDAELAKLRQVACREIFGESGLPGLLKLAKGVEFAGYVGNSTAESIQELDLRSVIVFLNHEEPRYSMFAKGFADTRVSDLESLKTILDDLKDDYLTIARLLNCVDDLRQAWDEVARRGPAVGEPYWGEFRWTGRGQEFALVNEAAQNLLSNGYASSALNLLSMYSGTASKLVDPHIVAESLELLTKDLQSASFTPRITSYEVEHLLNYLRQREFEMEKIVSLEWRLLPAMDYGYEPLSIGRALSESPQFFVEVVSAGFRSSDEMDAESMQLGAAERATQALRDWAQIPGSDRPDGSVNSDQLNSWLTGSRSLLASCGRTEIGELIIGEMLAKGMADEDGAWPCVAIRDAIEASSSPELGRGFCIGVANSRGTWSRGVSEGGQPERDLAMKYEQWATLFENRWPKTASLLRGISSRYLVEARREDENSRRWSNGVSG